MSTQIKITRVTTSVIRDMKKKGEKITMLTAYDYPTAAVVDEAGVDMILVGDSLGMVVLGYDSTIPVTMEDMLHHTKAVCRAAQRALVIGDMPFMSYQASVEEGVRNAGRFLKEAGAQAVKLEGGREVAEVHSPVVLPERLLTLLAGLLILKVTASVVSNYHNYFPPDFGSEFLHGRELYFPGAYRWAFYAHILSGPVSLILGLILIGERSRSRFPKFHRYLGRLQVACVLSLVTPSGLNSLAQFWEG